MEKHHVSERRACRALNLNLNRSGVRYKPVKLPDEDALTEAIIRKACEYGRYGYRRIARMIEEEGFHVNHKRVERIWREQGLKVPKKQPKKEATFCYRRKCDPPSRGVSEPCMEL